MNRFRQAAFGKMLAAASLAAVGFAAPAVAAKKDAAPATPAKNYSKEFVAAYKPVEVAANAATPDYAAIKAMLPGLIASAKTPDDQLAVGQMVYTVGQKSQDFAVAQQGAEIMINSGRADAKLLAQLQVVAAKLAYNAKDYATAQKYALAAVEGGSTEADLPAFVAETYFSNKDYVKGLQYLSDAIDKRKAAGQSVSEEWVKRALATAYTNKLNDDARRWGLIYARDFPGEASWGDAIAIAINTGDYAPAEMLDLLRLARMTNTLRSKQMYLEYADAADARKLPSEVQAVLNEGIGKKLVDPSIQMVKDAQAVVTTRLATDKAELPALVKDANGSAAKLVTVMAAADTLLSYNRGEEAIALYNKALAMPGANVALAQTRLGIAQVMAGKFADAQTTFAKVTGPRQPIAALWALYAAQKAVPAPIPTPAPAAI